MLHFECDYNNGCHENILKAFIETNGSYQSGYGFDEFTETAKQRIREASGCPDADIYFLAGGTQTNEVVISSFLKPYQGVIAAETGHIAVHEAGAIENTGHKVLTIPQKNGKISADTLDAYVKRFYDDGSFTHMVFPGMVYISFPTELGTIYTKQELSDIHSVCEKYGMPLYIDGARLGYGLMSRECDMTFKEFCGLCDAFYIGGTKVGALCGEAVVFPKGSAPEGFFTMVKQKGALLAKGRLVGVQFGTLFKDNLYFEISKNAIEKAEVLKKLLRDKDFEFYLETPTNQQFVITDNERLAKIREKAVVEFWDIIDADHTVIRFCTSWCTSDADLAALAEVL